MRAVLSSVCTTTVDNSGVYVYYLKGIVSRLDRQDSGRVHNSSKTQERLESLILSNKEGKTMTETMTTANSRQPNY